MNDQLTTAMQRATAEINTPNKAQARPFVFSTRGTATLPELLQRIEQRLERIERFLGIADQKERDQA